MKKREENFVAGSYVYFRQIEGVEFIYDNQEQTFLSTLYIRMYKLRFCFSPFAKGTSPPDSRASVRLSVRLIRINKETNKQTQRSSVPFMRTLTQLR